ncbi:hypothetical protein ACFQJD_04455 [Haloplanus sp. GCM10025708]|uniref:DUF7319 domain-containing protein n=1 Tax=Haloferacaceae TaxID=1644056 RepID=UPI0036161AB9
MADPSPTSADGTDVDASGDGSPTADGGDADDIDALRQSVEEKYDFENFGPSDMAEMTAEEWEAAFDPESWIVGAELLDRVEKELKGRIATRDVFATLERVEADGETRLLAYSDEGYALVYPDGSIEGRGTVLRDVKPTVALCSMDDYEVPEPPADFELPDPEDVVAGSGGLGNAMLQVVAAAQLLAGVGLLGVWLFTDMLPSSGGVMNLVPPVASLFFVAVGLFLFGVVANARLSDRFRAREYRARLRAMGLEDDERPEFVPSLDAAENEGTE